MAWITTFFFFHSIFLLLGRGRKATVRFASRIVSLTWQGGVFFQGKGAFRDETHAGAFLLLWRWGHVGFFVFFWVFCFFKETSILIQSFILFVYLLLYPCMHSSIYFCGPGNWAQDFAPAGLMSYHWTISLFLLSVLWQGLTKLPWTHSNSPGWLAAPTISPLQPPN